MLTIEQLRKRLNESHDITYTIMLRPNAELLVEFGNRKMHIKALEMMTSAFPNAQRLTDIGDLKLVLNTTEEVTYFKLIAASLRNADT